MSKPYHMRRSPAGGCPRRAGPAAHNCRSTLIAMRSRNRPSKRSSGIPGPAAPAGLSPAAPAAPHPVCLARPGQHPSCAFARDPRADTAWSNNATTSPSRSAADCATSIIGNSRVAIEHPHTEPGKRHERSGDDHRDDPRHHQCRSAISVGFSIRCLAGLRERVRLVGGTLPAGPREQIFEIVATLPHLEQP